jgi:peptide-methionine (S)-S-oxide reductase
MFSGNTGKCPGAKGLMFPDSTAYRRTAMTEQEEYGTATFGAGCFWGVEEAFRTRDGVVKTAAGYMGGTVKNPAYEQVCSGETGHAEVVQVTYDPAKISYRQLLDIFWSVHNPTQLNRQGPDIGPNYRSVIFYHDPEQGKIARKSKIDVETSGRFGFGKVVTQIQPAGEFYRAEEYHQQYFAKRGRGHCHI